MKEVVLQFFNKLRGSLIISLFLRFILTPIQRLSHTIEKQIRMKVYINGSKVNYDEVEINFPKNVGINLCSSIYWNGAKGFEPNVWNAIRACLSFSDLFIDIGSNIGFYSIMAKKTFPLIPTYSYEPIKIIYEKNLLMHKKNNLSTTNIFNAAISDKTGSAEIFLPPSLSLDQETTATLRKDSWQYEKAHTTFLVETIRLDDLKLTDYKSIVIKIDVEDFEYNVFLGAKKLLREKRPIVICEILPREHYNLNTVELLFKLGYSLYAISDDGFFKFSMEDCKYHRTLRDFLILPNELIKNRNYLSTKDLKKLY